MTVGVSNIDLGQRASILVLLTESDRCRSQRGAQAWLGLITKLAFWNWKSSEPLLANQIQNVSIREGICMSEGLILGPSARCDPGQNLANAKDVRLALISRQTVTALLETVK